MENYIGKKCPFCKAKIEAGDKVKVCSSCGTVHHAECWRAKTGCMYSERHSGGEQCIDPETECASCGTSLTAGQTLCPNCGREFSNVDHAKTYSEAAHRVKANVYIKLGVFFFALILLIVIEGGRTKNFHRMFSEYDGLSWCTIASDGSWMRIDTNPQDADGYTSRATLSRIETINKELGFPDSISREMKSTKAEDGLQSASNSKYKVSWTYSPECGLEILYELKSK